ncbi:sodium/calcium exchanger NCL2-like isoform X2 [Rhodamnia argentea]|uniref:Sodium/calcium exchanger NCL2-like isoform X2 n=1 Tax=Rhodamnia argentea TaxID=178133 RepID=A0ABM3H0G6_9MYRT|nr:sodium/calcium exchanger NCL2-like isoform X2 [Rhodamnia argentea]
MTLHMMFIRSIFTLVAILAVISTIDSRSLPGDSSPLISDGVDRGRDQHGEPSKLLLLRGTAVVLDDEVEVCEQMYGFLPCSYSTAGHLFLILVYEYLLFHGESYVASGSQQIFKVLGPGIFGASAFHVLSALPEALILLASGLLNSKEVAQEYVVTGVGLLAGSSILLLTLLWGTCVLLGSRDFCDGMERNTSSSSNYSGKKFLSSLKGSGIITDLKTSYTARIMVFSAIPFIMIQIPDIFLIYSAQRIVILCALAVSVGLLLLYFFYQIFEPWIQKRRLEYVKHEQLVLRIIQHMQRHALERLVTEDGAPNIQALRRLFEEIDHDGDDAISPSELKELLLEIKFKHEHVDKDKAVDDVIKEFDIDSDQRISKDKFVTGFTKWLEEAKITMDKQTHSKRSFKDLYQLFQPFIQKKEERKLKKKIVEEILAHVHTDPVENLFTENGTPDLPAIRRLFEQIDRNGDNSISQSELKELLMGIKFGDIPFDVDEVVLKVIEVFDRSGNRQINEEEFVTGLASLLDTSVKGDESQAPKLNTSQDDFYQRTWEETDKLVDEDNGKGDVEKSSWIWVKSISLLLLGVIIVSVLAEPLISSVQSFSTSAGIPSFFVSFILVPLATNARGATAAIKACRHKKARTTSLTFSEIYGEVFMSNMLGFCILLSLIYARNLTWEFSAEVLAVLIVCGVVGVIARFRSTFPVLDINLGLLVVPSVSPLGLCSW